MPDSTQKKDAFALSMEQHRQQAKEDAIYQKKYDKAVQARLLWLAVALVLWGAATVAVGAAGGEAVAAWMFLLGFFGMLAALYAAGGTPASS